MEELSFNTQGLKRVIDEGTLISDSGFSSAVFLHGNTLIKLHKELYHYLKINAAVFADSTFKRIYQWDNRPFVQREQIEYLQSKQKDIHRTDFDRGVVLVNDRICGVILQNHVDYKDLTNIEFDNPEMLLKIIYNILLALRELEEHQISHLDLAKAEKNKEATLNILYKDTDIKLCDLSGDYITYGENFNSRAMYQEYANVLMILLKKLENKYPQYKGLAKDLGILDIMSYEDATMKVDDIYNLVKSR